MPFDCERGAHFCKRDVSIWARKRENEIRLRFDGRRATISALRFRPNVTCRQGLRRPTDRAGNPDLKMGSRLAARHPAIDRVDNALAKIG
jgi:hypothetical protein